MKKLLKGNFFWKIRYYAYKKGPEILYLSIRKGNEEIDGYEVDNDSDFLFKYFEPIIR